MKWIVTLDDLLQVLLPAQLQVVIWLTDLDQKMWQYSLKTDETTKGVLADFYSSFGEKRCLKYADVVHGLRGALDGNFDTRQSVYAEVW